MKSHIWFFFFAACCLAACIAMAEPPDTPRIESVVMAVPQPEASDPAVIWYDDFDTDSTQYGEANGALDPSEGFGASGMAMLCRYEKGSQGKGGRKIFFGGAPTYSNKAVRKGEKFDEIYFRLYVKHQYGWTGSPAKLARATSLVSEKWRQAMIAHVWSSRDSSLTLDPASGVSGGKVVTTKYNDFDNLHWLGNRPVSAYPFHATSESGYWVPIECRVKLNTPGKRDGINQLWIDGRLECERTGLDFRGTYTAYGINAVFLEAYWNSGSPVAQSRWYDNFAVSTQPIGPVTCPANPVLIKTPYRGPGKEAAWEAEVAADYDGGDVVFRSNPLSAADRVTVDPAHGVFTGFLAGKTQLAPGIWYARVRQQSSEGAWSEWSRWHQGFRVR